jgi:hypothetical protein
MNQKVLQWSHRGSQRPFLQGKSHSRQPLEMSSETSYRAHNDHVAVPPALNRGRTRRFPARETRTGLNRPQTTTKSILEKTQHIEGQRSMDYRSNEVLHNMFELASCLIFASNSYASLHTALVT